VAPELQGLADVDAARREGVRTMAGVPMVAHGAVVGVLTLSSEEAGGLGPEELALVERIASTAAVAIENARLIGEITERTRALEREGRQQEALLRTIAELGSPVVPIAPGVLVMPLVGALDAARAGRFIEAMLREIKARRARVLLIDVTGMAMADAVAVHYLTRAARAASLLGAEVVLVGIDPRSAQLMVEQGADVGEVITHSNLELGFAYALSRTGGRMIHGR
jgi:anti-anti-sigma regulatory factor